jgi:hypothetical protein
MKQALVEIKFNLSILPLLCRVSHWAGDLYELTLNTSRCGLESLVAC